MKIGSMEEGSLKMYFQGSMEKESQSKYYEKTWQVYDLPRQYFKIMIIHRGAVS